MFESKSIAVTAAPAAVALFLAAGCSTTAPVEQSSSQSDSGAEGKISVLYHYETEPSKTAFSETLAQCSEDTGVEIDIQTIPSKDIVQKVLQLSTAGGLPDVLVLDNPDVQSIAETGALAPVTSFGISGDEYVQGFIDAATFEGNLYGVAPNANSLALFYNTEVFDAAGLEPPETWDELKSTAAALTEGDRYGMAFAAPASFEAAFQFVSFMWTNGGSEDDLTSPQVAEALELWTYLVENGYASPSVVSWSQSDVKEQFAAGKAAMMVGGSWHVPTLTEAGVPFGVVQIPVNKPGQISTNALGGEVWTIPETGRVDRQELAAQVIECVTSDEQQLSLAKKRNTVPAKTALLENYSAGGEHMEVFAESVRNAKARTGVLGPLWPETAADIYEAVQLSLTGQASPADAFVMVTD